MRKITYITLERHHYQLRSRYVMRKMQRIVLVWRHQNDSSKYVLRNHF